MFKGHQQQTSDPDKNIMKTEAFINQSFFLSVAARFVEYMDY